MGDTAALLLNTAITVAIVAGFPTATLVARESLHPALVQLFVQAAQQVHGGPGWFQRKGDFPNADNTERPIAAEAPSGLGSRTTTSKPSAASLRAAVRPATVAPITSTSCVMVPA